MQYTDKDLASVWKAIRQQGIDTSTLQRTLQMSKGQLDGIRRRNRKDWEAAARDYFKRNPQIEPVQQVKVVQTNIRLQAEKKELTKQLDAAIREKTVLEEMREMIEATVPQLPPLKHPPKPVQASKSGCTTETMVLNLGDLHGGEIVLPKRVKGMNHYNSEICRQRFAHYIQTHLEIKERLEAGGGWHFPELVVNLLGDIVSGTIHEIERHSDQTIIQTAMGLGQMIAEGIAHLAQHYPAIHVVGVVGNHGRLPDQRRKPYKDPERNWDYLVYLAVAQYLKQYPTVHCFFPSAYTIQMDIRGWKFQIAHLDDVKSWGGLPAYGLDRYARNQNAGEAMRGQHIDYFVGGHFHQKIEMDVGGAELIVNGDMKGTDEWVQGALGKSGEPRQLFFAVHEDHGITHRWDVKLQSPRLDVPQFSNTPWKDLEEDEAGEPIEIYRVASVG